MAPHNQPIGATPHDAGRRESPLRILLTNITLSERTGTEIVTRNAAMALSRRGHKCVVYCPALGEIADELRVFGIPVVEDIRLLQDSFDIIHGHHSPTTATAIARFPETPAIFVCHDFAAWYDTPPQLPAIRRFVAVDETVADRLATEAGIPAARMAILLNAVDLERFKPGPPLGKPPRRALAFAKNGVRHLDAIRTACEKRGISVTAVGAALGKVADRPEDLMPDFDIVFASALTAMEAIACGRAAIVCDARGLAGSITLQRFQAWRRLNFGLRTLRQPLDAEAIGREIDVYDPAESNRVCLELRREGGLETYTDKLVDLYRQAIDEHRQLPLDRSVGAVAMAYHVHQWGPRLDRGWPWMRERQDLLDRIETLQFGVAPTWPGQFRRFASGEAEKWWQPLSGLSHPEEWGVWTNNSFASLVFRIGSPHAKRLRCEIRLVPHVGSNVLVADVLTNGMPSAEWRFETSESLEITTREFVLPPTAIPASGEVYLAFRITGAMSPKDAGQSHDDRQLGVGVMSLLLKELDA